MKKRLFAGIGFITALVLVSCTVLFAADGSTSAKEPSSIFPEVTTPSIATNAPVQEKMYKPSEAPESFIAPEDWPIDGEIIGSRDDIHGLAQNDVVFVNVGSDDAVTQGTRCIIYRKGDYVDDAGIIVKALGELEIIGGVREKSATARIVYSHETVQIGDILEIE